MLIAVALALSIAAESSHPIIARSVHNETRIKLSTQGIMEKKPRSLLKRVKKSLIRHASSAAEHSSYVAAVAARSGKQLWHSRNVAAAFLVRFRLIAFTSEFGESFRPLMALWKVNLAYAVSWTYVILDVLLRAADDLALRGRTLRVVRTFLFFSIFHSIATMLIPAVVIHSSVHQVDHVLAKLLPMAAASTAASAAPNTAEEQSLWSSVAAAAAGFAPASEPATAAAIAAMTASAAAAADTAAVGGAAASTQVPTLLLGLRLRTALRTWLPSLVGLVLIPLMPLLDEPAEHLLEHAFQRLWPLLPRKRVADSAKQPALLTDYELAASLEDGGGGFDGVTRGLSSSSSSGASAVAAHHYDPAPHHEHEEPELQRATGKGEPSYDEKKLSSEGQLAGNASLAVDMGQEAVEQDPVAESGQGGMAARNSPP